ncbi:hypothetical protein KBZ20_08700 [Vulcanococcus limneticus Candia 3F8]|uniref:hypothetical protein n=1 Tax=Vulcanococcus limneticus TaxID=2170428 RepID=UPI0018E33554|nr:hypothetical protein [Vulcanococcus limneticus]MCP9792305.1 hypothetical protein [Vulcanococcus limneticus MW73D5]MCP9893850.1 hypothetical protein [Vulcanococcus limneticus Candia 3F8]MCP9897654.1 hypothetical protein [Vulcanococcus limneticus Candia 3B3]
MAVDPPAPPDAGTQSDGGSVPSRQVLTRELSEALGVPAAVVSVRPESRGRVRGLAVSSGRILSFVREAQGQGLRTRELFVLVRRTVGARLTPEPEARPASGPGSLDGD